MGDCSKIDTCGEFNIQNAMCVRYEGIIPTHSKYNGECYINVEEAIEELYSLTSNLPINNEYYNGTGLNLLNNTFSVNFGLTENTVMRGSWRPDWTEVKNKPTISEPLNLEEGNNIVITGEYPNLTISASGAGEENILERVNIGNTPLNNINKAVTIPIATKTSIGLVRIGNGINISVDGVISSDSIVYTQGSGITINNGVISNSSPNMTHTGDVTGSSNLTITPLSVTNSKLSLMPQNTIKGNNLNTESAPKDLTLQEVKQMIDITNQTLIYDTYPQTVTLNNKLHTAIFADVTVNQGNIIIPDGQFNGQIIYFGYNQLKGSDDNKVLGKFLVWADGNTSTILNEITNTVYTINNQNMYWSSSKQAWIIGRLGV